MVKKLLAASLMATAMFSTAAFAVSYSGDIKTSTGTYHHALAWTQASDGASTAMAYVAIYESSGVKLSNSTKNYDYGYSQTETITANKHIGNYAQSRHGAAWDNAFTKKVKF